MLVHNYYKENFKCHVYDTNESYMIPAFCHKCFNLLQNSVLQKINFSS